eukprot:11619922-Alexandrium_andersonii.AAC.1
MPLAVCPTSSAVAWIAALKCDCCVDSSSHLRAVPIFTAIAAEDVRTNKQGVTAPLIYAPEPLEPGQTCAERTSTHGSRAHALPKEHNLNTAALQAPEHTLFHACKRPERRYALPNGNAIGNA